MSLDRDIGRIIAEYPARQPRDSLDAVWRLRQALAPRQPVSRVGVVGTNGKTSTATYLARLLSASGASAGLYVSPHLSDWTERVRIDDRPCDADELLAALTAVHELAQSELEDRADLRFFDILTLAAEQLMAAVDVGVFEAGIGGRLDAVRTLEPEVVLLTSVSVDHAEILGDEPAAILREKLLLAPPGATVVCAPLGDDLVAVAESLAAEQRLRLVWVEADDAGAGGAGLPSYLHSALALAERGWSALNALGVVAGADPARLRDGLELRLPGRLEQGELEGVPYILDVAHNGAAWLGLGAELERVNPALARELPLTALVSVSPGKRIDDLPRALNALGQVEQVVLTRHPAMPAADPDALAASLADHVDAEAIAVGDFDAAVDSAFDRARSRGGGVLVFGSTHLVGAVRRRLGSPD